MNLNEHCCTVPPYFTGKGVTCGDLILGLSINKSFQVFLTEYCEMLKRQSTQKIQGISDLKNLVLKRFENIDFQKAKAYVLPFIKNSADLNSW